MSLRSSLFPSFRSLGLLAATLGILSSGCRREESAYPEDPPTMVAAQPEVYQEIIIETEVTAEASAENPGLIGYEKLSDGQQVQVVTYVHTYPEAIETYPRVWWSGRWYYNINGSFVYYSPYYSSWCYYWGPPMPLVYAWNFYYPWTPYYWGVGYYGAGWYWGGVGVYGYHAYGVPPASYVPPRGVMPAHGGPSRGGMGSTHGGSPSPGGPGGTGRSGWPGGAGCTG
ncbi:MAG TPA: hypothetical protein PKW35_19410, partial [Nannocystaceae bacterium]|nr:hypothetical protein [Nannocystaceae bacterium]